VPGAVLNFEMDDDEDLADELGFDELSGSSITQTPGAQSGGA